MHPRDRARPNLAPALGLLAILAFALTPQAKALPPPEPPRTAPSPGPSVTPPPGPILPFGSSIYFVIDDKIDSGATKPGTTIHMHLRSALLVNGVSLAPAGAPATLEIITTHKAATGDEDGAIQAHLDPFTLPGREQVLPIRLFHEYLTMERTAGQLATRDTTDTIADIFVPFHMIYHALRPGQQFILPPGAVLRAETGATIDASNPRAVVLSTPPPFSSTYDPPHSDITAQPLYTPAPMRPKPLPHGKPTLPPTAAPTVAPTDTPASDAVPSPVAS